MKSWQAGSALVVAGVFALTATPALANEPSSKEAQLEQRINELEAQLEQVMTQMQTNSTSQTNLETRISELQTSMAGADNGLNAYWANGIRMDSADKMFKFEIGGRIQNDWAWFDEDSDARAFYGNDAFQGGTEFRRARMYMAGTIYGNVGFKAEYDFAGGEASFKDVYLQMKDDCIGTLTVGHQYEPFGLDVQTSSKYITFMERNLVAQMSPERSTGISLANSFLDDAINWRVGAFRNSDEFGDDTGNLGAGEWAFTGRASGTVWADKEAENPGMLAIGGSVSLRKPSDEIVNPAFARPLNDEAARVRLRGAQHLGPRLVDTGNFAADDDALWYGLDAAFVMGPFHAQAEWMNQDWDVVGGDADLMGWAVQAGFFLTGEPRAWKNGNWSRTSPNKNYGDEGGVGAWEIAARYDEADLDDGAVAGGDIEQWTIGLNWYLNPNTRVMWNYAMIDLDDASASVDVFEMRFQIDF